MSGPRLHFKGFMLQMLAERGDLWDYEIAAEVMAAYEIEGPYWYGTMRLTLTDLYSGGLLDEVETTVDPSKSFGVEKVLFKFRLNDFGRERMEQSGLAPRKVTA